MKRKLKLISTAVVCLFFAVQVDAQTQYQWTASAQLDVNNVNARVRIGDLWFSNLDGLYNVPKDDPNQVSAIRGGGLWMSGLDPGGGLKVSAMTKCGPPHSPYWPGPLDPSTGLTTEESIANWNLMFEIYSSELALHLQDYNDEGIINEPMATNILGWPGRGNPEFFGIHGFELPDQELAPFFDRDNDGVYEPMEGDFPLMKGEKAIWWIMNDAGEVHPEPTGDAISIEIHGMAYAYSSSEDYLNNTTFYDFHLINQANEDIGGISVGLWLDPELGCGENDYLGSAPEHDLAFVYNAEEIDEDCETPGYGTELPVLGIKMLGGIKDDTGNSVGLTNVMYYGDADYPDIGTYQSAPETAEQCYNYMHSLWRDGNPLTKEGNGYTWLSNEDPYSFVFDDSEDINGSPWTMHDQALPSGNNRMIISSSIEGGYIGNMKPKESRYFSFAVLWTQDAITFPDPDFSPLFAMAQKVEDFYETIGDGLYSNTSELLATSTFVEIFPNPASDAVQIKLKDANAQIQRVEVFNISGQKVFAAADLRNLEYEIPTESWSRGTYLVRILSQNGKVQTERLILQ